MDTKPKIFSAARPFRLGCAPEARRSKSSGQFLLSEQQTRTGAYFRVESPSTDATQTSLSDSQENVSISSQRATLGAFRIEWLQPCAAQSRFGACASSDLLNACPEPAGTKRKCEIVRKLLQFPFLLGGLVVFALVITLHLIGAVSASGVIALSVMGQMVFMLLDRQRPALFMAVLTQKQIDEFSRIMDEMEPYGEMLKTLPERLNKLEGENDELRSQLKKLNKASLVAGVGSGIYTIGDQDFLSNTAADALGAYFVIECEYQGRLKNLVKDDSARHRILQRAYGMAGAGVNSKTALDPSTTPLPTIFMPQIVELVWKYGQARQYATVYPLGAGTVKLPRLKAGEDDFGYLGAGTGGMSQSVPEKRPTAELVTFTANKAGGIIRIPTEIEEDTFIPLGQFLARYIARQLAKLEDKTLFLADGSGTYANQTGVGPYCVANPTYLQQLAAGKTKISDATINDFRVVRAKINPAALVDNAAYYMNPTMEGLLVTFNTIGQPLIYRPQNGNQPATLDGFPIRWVGILPAYSTVANPNAFVCFFGALNYWYLGERGAPRIEVSRDVYFATDEVAMRALERIDIEAMAIDAMATLQTAAA